jgi:hypothetical protein
MNSLLIYGIRKLTIKKLPARRIQLHHQTGYQILFPAFMLFITVHSLLLLFAPKKQGVIASWSQTCLG